ncbi:hypothetical protein ABIF90_000871 [Bradyrhizobium japonicum]
MMLSLSVHPFARRDLLTLRRIELARGIAVKQGLAPSAMSGRAFSRPARRRRADREKFESEL